MTRKTACLREAGPKRSSRRSQWRRNIPQAHRRLHGDRDGEPPGRRRLHDDGDDAPSDASPFPFEGVPSNPIDFSGNVLSRFKRAWRGEQLRRRQRVSWSRSSRCILSPPSDSAPSSALHHETTWREERKVGTVDQAKAPGAKRFKSPVTPVPVRSPGIRLMLSPKIAFPSTAPTKPPSPILVSPSQGFSHRNRRRKLKSDIWTQFEPIYDGRTLVKTKCIHCNKILNASRNLGTSGCRRHLKSCEGKSRLDHMVTQLKSDSLVLHDDTLEAWKFDQERSEHELVKLIVVHELPLSFVEYEKFRTFVSTLNPYFVHLSRTTIKKYCIATYDEGKERLQKLIDYLCRFSLTADLWTSTQTLGYLCVTCHYINAHWTIKKSIIKFTSVETPHDGINLFNAMLRTLQDWNLENKIFAITLDNSATNDSFMSSLKENLVAKGLLFQGGKLFHFRCAAHVINLIAQEGFKSMTGAIDNIRESVKYVRSSPARKERFQKIVRRVGIPCSPLPKLDVASRWNSTYEMLNLSFGYKRAFETLAREDPQYVHQPSIEEWNMAKKLCGLLKVFSKATKVVSGCQYPTANLYFHQLWEVKKILEKEASSSEVIIVSMVQQMKKKLQKYWELSFLKICIPVILNPRFKMGFLEFRLKQGFGEMAVVYFSKIDKTFRELFDEYSLQSEDAISNKASASNKNELSVDDNNLWTDWGQYQNLQQTKTISELEEYLNEETVPIGGTFDILDHWKIYSKKYPILGRMARDILAIPASSVASESAFSTGERVISDYRSRLTSDTVEVLICLQDWLRSKGSHSNYNKIAGNSMAEEEDDDVHDDDDDEEEDDDEGDS